MPAPTPQDYRGKKVLQQPYDENNKPIPALYAAITNPGTGLIIGYLPVKAIDNGDGTATIKVDTEIDVNGDIVLSNVKVGSIDQTVSGLRYLKVLGDGTVVVDKSGLALETTLAAIKVKTDGLNFIGTSLDVKESVQQALLAVPSSAIGNKLKVYEELIPVASSPKTYNIKTDINTKYVTTTAVVRFLRLQADKNTSVAINGDTEQISLNANEIFMLSNFNIVSMTITLLAGATNVRILAEGF